MRARSHVEVHFNRNGQTTSTGKPTQKTNAFVCLEPPGICGNAPKLSTPTPSFSRTKNPTTFSPISSPPSVSPTKVRGNGDKKRKKARQSRNNVFERGLSLKNLQETPEEKIGSNWYPQMHDPKATSCKKDTNYPSYMKLDPKRWLFPEADDCCKSFYFWDSDCVQKSVASSKRWYPEFTGIGGCKDDDNAPQFMKAYDSYFVDTLETCCETYFVWNVKGCMEPVHPEPEPCPDNAEEDTAETEHD
eukprot:scaffold4240_cov212-Alexandrium_tamarense.AAC.6